MRVVVTGGAGFIGSHLVKRLLDDGREIVVADDFSKGSRLNLLDLGVELECEIVDLRDYGQASKVIDGADVVYHLAARVGSVEYLHGDEMAELKTLQDNIVIDVNVFRACMEKRVKKIIYASSVSVYPIDLQQKPDAILSEDDLQYYNPEGGYGWAKLLGEIQLSWMKDIEIGIARIFNIYGPCAALDETAQVIPSLIRKAIMYPKEDFIVWGNGNQTRCFTYISDCIDALIRLEDKTSNPPSIVNVGSDKSISIRILTEKIVEIIGKDVTIKYDPTKPTGPRSRTADITRARNLLGWNPKINLEEGLRLTYSWVEKRLKMSYVS